MKDKRFGRLTVIDNGTRLPNRTRVYECLCECGVVKKVDGGNLRHGVIKSCGCLRREIVSQSNNNLTHGMRYTPEYQAWINMRRRCDAGPDTREYAYYGAKGITVCERWLNSFEAFYEDMGPRPSPDHSIDRRENDKGYYKNNCRWATWEEQQNNRSNNSVNTVDGVVYSSIAKLAREKNISEATVKARIYKQNMSVEEAVSKGTNRYSLMVNGESKSVNELSEITNKTSATIRYHLRRGRTVEDILKDR
jgi:hypothetical protein